MMKFTLFPLILLFLLVSGCAQKHFTRLEGDAVAFYYRTPEAKEVLFASSIDNYKLQPTHKIKKDLWEVSVPVAKEFAYFYVVDGVITLPDCTYTEKDDFGSKNCLYIADM
jgi:hypothetical protein